jgi:hypothetical protein
VTVSWTELLGTSTTYQVAVQQDDGPWTLLSCIPANNPTRSTSANWIALHHDYRFSLRKNATSCSTIDPTAIEVASTTALATNAQVTTTNPRVVTNSTGTTTINWLGAYQSYNRDTSSYVPNNNQVWVQQDYGPPTLFGCSGPGTPGSSAAPWIFAGHTYRFSLNPTPAGCGDTTTRYPEVAAVTVTGVQHFLDAIPNRCSVAPGGSCATTLSFQTSTTGVQPQVWEFNETTWTKLAHCPPTAAELNRTVPAGKTYKYELHLPSSCTATRTSTPVAATAVMSALSGFVVRQGTALKVDGQPYRAMGLNKPELFQLYLKTANQSGFVACSAPSDETCCPSQPGGVCTGTNPVSAQCQAEHDMLDAVNRGAQYLRIAGASWDASSPGGNGAELRKYWLGLDPGEPNPIACRNFYQQKLDALLNYAQSIGLKIVTNMGWESTTFPTLVGTFAGHSAEHLEDLIKNPNSLSRKLYLRFAQDLTEGCVNLPAIPELGLVAGCNGRTVDTTGHRSNPAILAIEVKGEDDLKSNLDLMNYGETNCTSAGSGGTCYFTTDDLAAFTKSVAQAIRGWDPNHLLGSNTTSLRTLAAHLRAWPQWVASSSYDCLAPGDWVGDPKNCQDDANMYNSMVEYLHPEPIDLASVHPYNGAEALDRVPPRDNMRFGLSGIYNAEIFRFYKRAADRIGRPLMVGEFADFSDCDATHPPPQCLNFPAEYRRPFARAALKRIADLHIPLSAPWVWEFRVDSSQDANFNIQPSGNGGLDDEYMTIFGVAKGLLNTTATTMNVSPINPSFETDVDANGIPDGWTATGSVSAGSTFDNKSVHLQYVNGVPASVLSTGVSFGFVQPAGTRLHIAAAARSNSTGASITVFAYDSNGAFITSFSLASPSDQVFRVLSQDFALPSSTRSIRVGAGQPVSGYSEYDDVSISVSY